MSGWVEALHVSGGHSFSKRAVDRVEVVAGIGITGDAHAGATVRHRSRVRADPSQPNLRQVHLMHAELFDALTEAGHHVAPGSLGENITTRGVDLLGLSTGSLLRLGDDVILAATGLRNPCGQIENFQTGLLERVRRREDDGIVRLAGIMAVVVHGGSVAIGDVIDVTLPRGPAVPLAPV